MSIHAPREGSDQGAGLSLTREEDFYPRSP